MQLDFFTTVPEWKPPRVSELPDWRNLKLVGVDTETKDPGLLDLGPGFIRGDAKVIGISLAIDRVNSFYLPIGHYSQNVEDVDNAIKWTKAVVESADTCLFANAHYDMDALATLGIHPRGRVYDVQVVDAVIDETAYSYSLENIAQRRLNEGKLSNELVALLKTHNLTMSDLYKLDAGSVAGYAERDASLLPEVWLSQQEDITKYDLAQAVDMETQLTKVLWKMHQKGVPINVSRADRLNEEWRAEADAHLVAARQLAGWNFNPDSPKSAGAALRSVGILPNVTKAGNDSVTNELLELHTKEPLAFHLLRYRQINKTRRDYCEGVFLKYEINGRIHPQWFQSRNSKKNEELATGASTGRITGSKPNLTQIPVRSDIGRRLREVVVAEKGKEYCKLDYSSQEPRIGLHFAVVAGLPGANEAQRRYIENKRTDYHEMTRELIFEKSGVEIIRRDAKTMNLGLTYGMQLNSLAERLGISKEEAKPILAAYHEGVPYVEKITKLAEERVRSVGYIRTIGGRLRHFNKWESSNYHDKGLFDTREQCLAAYGSARLAGTHKAFNSAVQGSAADQMKHAIIELSNNGYLPMLQVYDECAVSITNLDEAREISNIMEEVVDKKLGLTVPSLVDPEIGPNWGRTKKIENM